ncbi:hypothetical protein MASR1M45_20010 [Candidatus Kapaibacterium sp.]
MLTEKIHFFEELLSSLDMLFKDSKSHKDINDLYGFIFAKLTDFKVFNSISFFLLNKESYIFEFTGGSPSDLNHQEIYEFLVQNEIISSALYNIEIQSIQVTNNEFVFVSPMIDFDGVFGILIIKFLVDDSKMFNILTMVVGLVSNHISLLISSFFLKLERDNAKSMQEQIIALRTLELERNQHLLKLKMDQLTTNLNRTIPHEIRTPFLHILGLTDYLIKHPDIESLNDTNDIKDIANDLHSAAKTLNSILDNYIYYASLVTKSFSIEELEFENSQNTEDVDSIIYEIAYEQAYKYNRSSDLKISLTSGNIIGTRDILSKLFLELIDNALKFSTSGSQLDISSELSNEFYIVKIHDKGIGMEEQEIKNIGPYVQFDRSKNEQQGLGLGLAIVTKILAILNGDIDIKSKKGEFTSIKVFLRQK